MCRPLQLRARSMGSALWRSVLVVVLFRLIAQPGSVTAIRIPGRVPEVLRADEKLDAVMKAFQRLSVANLRRAWEGGGEDESCCSGREGFERLQCQRLVLERRLADDYQDAQANVNEKLAPLPA